MERPACPLEIKIMQSGYARASPIPAHGKNHRKQIRKRVSIPAHEKIHAKPVRKRVSHSRSR
jgi:hypothetical protein